jgi:putative flippase GtrA
VFKSFCGMTISDTQTGLRAIPRKALTVLNTVKGDRFEYETNMLLALKENSIAFDEVKIRTVYIEENKSSHFRAVRDSWRIYKLILAHFFKYTASSLLSSVVDEGLFLLLTWALAKPLSGFALKAVPVVVARVISSLLNFYMNRKLVFRSKVSHGTSLRRYFLLAVGIALGQMVLTFGICTLFQIQEHQLAAQGIVYAVVMSLLFAVSFFAQQRWVFAHNKAEE